jgi:hypothetical protein
MPNTRRPIKEAQIKDKEIQRLKKKSADKEIQGFKVDEQGILWYENRICVPGDDKLTKLILDEAHCSAYSIHPVQQKYIWISSKNIGGLE